MKNLLARLTAIRNQTKRPLIGAHRGASFYFPENTLNAFAGAIAAKADFIELDVQLSKDDIPIVLHDDTIDRTTAGHGLSRNYTSNELAAFNIPSLRQVLELTAGRIYLNIELKAIPQIGLLADKVLALVRQYELDFQVIISSFDHTVLPYIKSQEPKVATGLLYESPLPDPVAYAHALKADALHPHFTFVNRALVADAHKAQLSILTWTVDEPQLIRNFLLLPVDGIISNRPDVALAVANALHIQ